MPASSATNNTSPPNRVERSAMSTTPQRNAGMLIESYTQQPSPQQYHRDRDHHHRSQHRQHNNHGQYRNYNHNNNLEAPPLLQQQYYSKQNGYSGNSKDNTCGGVRSIKVCANKEESDSVSDKQNQNTWFITNEQMYYDSLGNIPVIPLFTHTGNSADFHKNKPTSNGKNKSANGVDNSKGAYPNGTSVLPNTTNDFVCDEEDLLNMGRIQELRDRMGSERVKINEKALWKCLGAEFVGTALLMFLGTGCILKLEHEEIKGLSFAGIALCWGFTVATLVQSLGGVSCDINPAVTLACLVTGKIPVVKAIMYIIIQCVGALAGISLLKAVTPDSVEGNWGNTVLAPGVTPIQGCMIEIISTFILVLTAFSVSDENRKDVKGSVPLAIGLCVCAIVMCSGPLTGASLNPARTLAPCILTSSFDNHWVYWVGPIVGAISAGVLYQNVFRQLRPDEVEALEAETQLRRQEREAKENGSSPPV